MARTAIKEPPGQFSDCLDSVSLLQLPATSNVVEVVFDVSGQDIPVDHGYKLFSAIAHHQAQLHNLDSLGIQTLTSTVFVKKRLRLTPSSKLRIRLPRQHLHLVTSLRGKMLVLDGSKLLLNFPKIYSLRPAKTLYARMVVIKGYQQPDTFLISAQNKLKRMGIKGDVHIPCYDNGNIKRKTLKVRNYTVVGFGLEITDLTKEDSLALQASGIGGKRKMGCGIFVPKAS